MSCASAGFCGAVGGYVTRDNGHHPFISAEKNGTWQPAIEVPGISALNAEVDAGAGAVSCVSAGNCALAGFYHDQVNQTLPFVADETGGTWGPFQPLPGLAGLNVNGMAEAAAISCRAPGICSTGGTFSGPFIDPPDAKQAYVADERSGGWDVAVEVFGPTINSSNVTVLRSLSCGSAGNCAAGGSTGGGAGTFLVNEVGSSWGNGFQVSGVPERGHGGYLRIVRVAGQLRGWRFLHRSQPALAGVRRRPVHRHLHRPDVVRREDPLRPRAGRRLTVQVKARTSGTPGGTVTVTAGTTVICVITLAGGKGTCTLKASQLRPGRYQLTATYGGSQVYGKSTSAKRTLTVTK